MPTNLPKKRQRVTQGPTGDQVAHNLARIRKASGVTAEQLVSDMAEAGHKLPRTAISDIENCYRKIGVDDLMALCVALNVNPNALLLPNYSGDTDVSDNVTAVAEGATGADVWAWADGWQALPQNCTEAIEIDASVTGAERGRLEAERRMGSWDFLGKIRPQGEARSGRNFLASVSGAMRKIEPNQWITLWVNSDKARPESTRAGAWPESGGDMFKYFDRIRKELAGLLSSEEIAPFIEDALQKRAKNGND